MYYNNSPNCIYQEEFLQNYGRTVNDFALRKESVTVDSHKAKLGLEIEEVEDIEV